MTILWLIVWALEGFPDILNELPADNNDTEWLIALGICVLVDIAS